MVANLNIGYILQHHTMKNKEATINYGYLTGRQSVI